MHYDGLRMKRTGKTYNAYNAQLYNWAVFAPLVKSIN